MVLGPEQVTWTTIFHDYLRSSVTNFWGVTNGEHVTSVIGGASHRWCRSPGVESLVLQSSVVQVTGVIGGVCHRGHRWCKSPGVIGGVCHRGNRWYRSAETSVVYYSSYYIHLFAIFYF